MNNIIQLFVFVKVSLIVDALLPSCLPPRQLFPTRAPGGGELNLANYTHVYVIVSLETSAISRGDNSLEYGGAGGEEAALCVLAEEIMQRLSVHDLCAPSQRAYFAIVVRALSALRQRLAAASASSAAAER